MGSSAGLVKLCGMTRAIDVHAAAEAGADCVGFVVNFPRSPRSLTVDLASRLARSSKIPVVAVVVNLSLRQLRRIHDTVSPAAFQLSGDESPELIGYLKSSLPSTEVWKVIHLPQRLTGRDLDQLCERAGESARTGADRIMLDGRTDGMPGGTGIRVNWDAAGRVREALRVSVVLAGGLAPVNVREAIETVRPGGVDVSSGTEISPGIKDPLLLREFVTNARLALDNAWRKLGESPQTRDARL